MKNKILFLILLLTISLISCNDKELLIDGKKGLTQKEAFENLKAKLNSFNATYFQRINFKKENVADLDKPVIPDIGQERWFWDLIHFWAADFSIQLGDAVSELYNGKGCIKYAAYPDEYRNCVRQAEARAAQFSEDIAKKMLPNMNNDSISTYLAYNKIDTRYPVKNNYIELVPGYEGGYYHNAILQRAYEEFPDMFFNSEFSTGEVIYNIAKYDFGIDLNFEDWYMSISENNNFLNHITEETTIDEFFRLTDEFYPELSDYNYILKDYFVNSSLLPFNYAVEYARDYCNIILNSDLSEEFKSTMINGLSTAINSRALWNMQLPIPYASDKYTVFDFNNSRWIIADYDYCLSFAQSQPYVICGIPKIIHGEVVSELIFYYDHSEFLPLDIGILENHFFEHDFFYYKSDLIPGTQFEIQNEFIDIASGKIYTCEFSVGTHTIIRQKMNTSGNDNYMEDNVVIVKFDY